MPISSRTPYPSPLLKPLLDRLTSMLNIAPSNNFLSGFSLRNNGKPCCLASGIHLELNGLSFTIFSFLENNCERIDPKNSRFSSFQKKPSSLWRTWHQRFFRTR
jgi:hypothetical protein